MMAAANKRKSVLLWQAAVCTARHVCIRLYARSIFENSTGIFFTKFSIQDLHLQPSEDFFDWKYRRRYVNLKSSLIGSAEKGSRPVRHDKMYVSL
jgi:hypothetical protein